MDPINEATSNEQKHQGFIPPEPQYPYMNMMHGIFPVQNLYQPHPNGFFTDMGYGGLPEKRRMPFNTGELMAPLQNKRFKEIFPDPAHQMNAYQLPYQNSVPSCSKEGESFPANTFEVETPTENSTEDIDASANCVQEMVVTNDSEEEADPISYKEVPNISWARIAASTVDIGPMPLVEKVDPVIQKSSGSPLETFLMMLSEDILLQIIEETNIFGENAAEKYVGDAAQSTTKYHKSRAWKPIRRDELMTYIGITFYMSVKPLRTLKQYWENSIWGDTVVPKHMTRDRYLEINRTLHFANNDNFDDTNLQFNVKKMEKLLSSLQTNFKRFYYPGEHLCLDENVIDWKWQWSPKSYIKPKNARCGVRLYALCDSETGYCLHFNILSEGTCTDSKLGKSLPGALSADKVVCSLVEPYSRKGHTVFLGNYCCSPFLCLFLKNRAKIDLVSMFRPNDKQLAKDFGKLTIKAGESIDFVGEILNSPRINARVLVQKWAPKEEEYVHIMSTRHDNRMVKIQPPNEKKSIKPLSVADFNKYMCGIDKLDQTMEPFSIERTRGMKWTVKVFKRLLNYILHNSHIVHGSEEHNSSSIEFRKAVVEEIFSLNGIKEIKESRQTGERMSGFTHIMKSTGKKKCCWYCPRYRGVKDRRTVWVCPDCNNKQLCKSPCFAEFHEKLWNGELDN